MLNQINKSCFFIFILGCAFCFQCDGKNGENREKAKFIKETLTGGEEEAQKKDAVEKLLKQ